VRGKGSNSIGRATARLTWLVTMEHSQEYSFSPDDYAYWERELSFKGPDVMLRE